MTRQDANSEAYTQCPACQTVFRITAVQLGAVRGWARCGHCRIAFDARRRLRDSLPTGLPAARPSQEPSTAEAIPAAGPGAMATTPLTIPAPENTELPRTPGYAELASSEAVSAPLELDWQLTPTLEAQAPPARRWSWLLALLVGLAVLPAQLLWHERDRLALDPTWRPAVQTLCQLTGCEPPLLRRPQAVRVVQRTLRVHPQVDDALLLTARIVNTADEPQPWPQLGLRLTDMAGKQVGQRWFARGAYVASVAGRSEAMPAGKPIPVRLAIRDVGRDARNFELNFR